MSEEECQSPRLSRWLGAAASARGRGHVSKDLPCQDASLAVVDDGVAMVITSDGAGSAGFSDQGAEIAVRCTAEVLAQNAPWDDLDALKDRVIDACTAALEARARDLAAAVGQLAATLSFVALHRDSCVVGNLGDGLVAGYSNSAASLLTTQAKGEFANETVFLTSSSARRRLELRRCRADAYDGFVVMTDGAAESLFQRRSGTLAPAVDRMLRWLDENTPGAVEKALTESALPMLLGRTMDDCTVALLRRVTVDVEQLVDRPADFQHELLGTGSSVGLRNRLAVLRHYLEGSSSDAVVAATGLSARTIRRHEKAVSSFLIEV